MQDLTKNRSDDRNNILKVFSAKKWKELLPEEKCKHKLFDCDGCLNDVQLKEALGLFFITTKFKKVAEENGIIINKAKENKKKIKRSDVRELVRERIPQSMLKTYDELISSETVKDINKKYKSTSVIRYFGGDVSLRCLNRHKMVQQFESKGDAVIRTLQDKKAVEEGRKRPRNPIGNINKYKWQSDECLEFVESLEDGSFMNYSELARMFGLKDGDMFGKDNKNQIVKQFLINNGVDVEKFGYHKKTNAIHVRRKKLKLDNNSRISIPTEPTIEEVKRELNLNLQEGKYTMGELIVPITFKKCVLTDGVLKYEEFEVRGRKTPLREIRRTLYKKHKSLYRIQSDDEIDAMSQSEIIDYLKNINEFKNNENEF